MQKLLNILFNTDRYPTASRKEQAQLLYWMAAITFFADAIIVFFVPHAAGSSILATAVQSGSYSGLLTSLALMAAVFVCGGLVRYGFYSIGAWLLNAMLFFAIASTG